MSKSIDERIVQMRFDNAAFEKGVAQTKKSLEELKEKTQFKNTSKGLEEISKAAHRVDLSPLSQGIETVNMKFSAMRTVAETVFKNLTTSAMQTGSKIVNALISPIVEGGKNRALNLENAQFQIEGLLGKEALEDGLTAWEKVKDAADYAVTDTAYGLDAAAKAASQLAASGIDLGKDMKDSLRGISGVAAMTNSDFDSIAQIFTKVAGNGRLMGEELNQLSARGINAAATLAQQMGITEKEVRDMTSKGQIDFLTFAKAMDNAFGEHAKDANNTFTGSLSNMKAALARIGADFWSPFLNVSRDVFNTMTALFKQLKPLLSNSITNSINENVRKVANSFMGWINKITEGLRTAKIGLEWFIPIWSHQADKYGQVIEGGAEQAEEAWNRLISGEVELSEEAWKRLVSMTDRSKETLMQSQEWYAAQVFSGFKNAAESLRESISAVFYAVANSFKIVSNFIGFKSDMLSIAYLVNSIALTIKRVTTGVSDSLGRIADMIAETRSKFLNDLMKDSENWSGEMSSLLSFLVNVISTVIGKLVTIFEKVMTIIGYVLKAVEMIYLTISSIIQEIVNSISSKIISLKMTSKNIISIWDEVKKHIEWGLEVLSKVLIKIFQTFDALWNNLVFPVISVILTIVFRVRDVVVTIFNILITAITKFIDLVLPVLTTISTKLSGVILDVLQYIAKVINTIATMLADNIIPAFEYLWTTIKPIFDYLKESFKTIIKDSGLLEIALLAISKVTDFFAPKIKKIKDTLSKMTGDIKKNTENWENWKRALDKITNLVDRLAHKLVELVSKIVDFTKRTVETVRSSEAFAKISETLKDVITTIKDSFGKLSPTMKSLKDSFLSIAKSATGSLIPTLVTLAGKIVESIAPAIVKIIELFDSFIKAAIKMGSQVKESLGPAFEGVGKTVKSLSDTFGGFVGGKISSITNFFDDFAKGTQHIQATAEDGTVLLDDTVTKAERASQNYKAVAEYYKEGTKTISHEMRYASRNMKGAIEGVAEVKEDSKTVSQNLSDTLNNLINGPSTGNVYLDTLKYFGGTAYKGGMFIFDMIKSLGDIIKNLVDGLKSLSPQMTVLITYLTTSMVAGIKVVNSLRDTANSFKKMGEGIGSLGSGFKALGDALLGFAKYKNKIAVGIMIKAIGLAVLEVAAAFVIIAFAVQYLDLKSVIWATAIIGTFFALMIVLGAVFSDRVDKSSKELKPNRWRAALLDVAKSMLMIGGSLIMVAISFEVLTFALKSLNGLKLEDLWQGITALGIMILLMVGLMHVSSRLFSVSTQGPGLVKAGEMYYDGSYQITNIAKGLILYAAAIWVLAKALKSLKGIKLDEINEGIAALAALMGLFMLLILVSKSHAFSGKGTKGALQTASDNLFQYENSGREMALALKGFATAIVMLSISLKILSTIEPGSLNAGMKALETILGIFVAMIAIVSLNSFNFEKSGFKAAAQFKKNEKTLASLSGALMSFAGAILLISASLFVLSLIHPDKLENGMSALMRFMLVMTIWLAMVEVAANKLTPARLANLAVLIQAMGIFMLAISSSLLILAGALMIISNVSPSGIVAGEIVFGIFLAEVSYILTYVQKHVRSISNNWKGIAIIAGFIMSLALDMMIIAAAIKVMSTIDFPSQLGSVFSLAVILGALLAVTYAIVKFQKEIAKGETKRALILVGSFIMAMAATMLIIATAIKTMSGIDFGTMIGSVAVLIGFFTIMGAAIAMISIFAAQIYIALPAFALVGGALIVLAISMSVFVNSLKKLSEISKEGADNIAYTIKTAGTAMISLFPILGTALAAGIANFLVELASQADRIGEAINTLLTTIVAKLISHIGERIRMYLDGIVQALTIITEYLPTIINMIFDFLIQLLDGLIARLPELVERVVQLVFTFFASVVDALGNIDFPKLIEGLTAVGLMTAITAGLAAISLLIPLAIVGLFGLLTMAALMTEVFSWLASIEGFASKIDKASEVAKKLGGLIGDFIGSIAGGIVEGFASHLENIGTDLTKFSETISGFINNLANMNTDGLVGKVAMLTAAIALLSAGEFVATITGLGDLPQRAVQLTAFALAMMPFISICASIPDEAVAGAKALSTMILAIAGAELADSLSLFSSMGEVIDTFIQKLPGLGRAIAEFGFAAENINTEATLKASEAAKNLAEMAKALPNTGGVAGFFAGNNDMDTFGTQLEKFGESLVKFSDSVSTLSDEKVSAINKAAEAGKALAEMAEAIPNTGGLVSAFTGDNDPAVWGKSMESLGTSLVEFSKSVGSEGFNTEAINTAVGVMNSISEMADEIPNSGGLVTAFTGDNDPAIWGFKLYLLGSFLYLFSKECENIQPDGCVRAVEAFVTIGNKIKEFADITISDVLQVMLQYGPALNSIASTLSDFSEELGDGFDPSLIVQAVDGCKILTDAAIYVSAHAGDLEKCKEPLKTFTTAIEDMTDTLSDTDADELQTIAVSLAILAPSITNFGNSLLSFSSTAMSFGATYQDAMNVFVNATNQFMFTVYSVLDSVNQAIPLIGAKAAEIITTFCTTMSSTVDASIPQIFGMINHILDTMISQAQFWMPMIREKGKELISSLFQGAEGEQGNASGKMVMVAVNVAAGLARGLLSGAVTSMVNSAVRSLVNIIPEGIRKILKIQSPSKVMIGLAKYIPMGLAVGIRNNSDMVNRASENMVLGMTNAIEETINTFNEDADLNPTIRPVVDMSNVRTSSREINSMLSGTSFSMAAGIQARIKSNRYYDPYSDITSAINTLHNDLQELDANNYTVNGITYDDGSNVANAVGELISAVKVGRRA